MSALEVEETMIWLAENAGGICLDDPGDIARLAAALAAANEPDSYEQREEAEEWQDWIYELIQSDDSAESWCMDDDHDRFCMARALVAAGF